MEGWICFFCKGSVMWKSDFTFDEFGAEGDGIVHVCECSKCGAEYVVYESIEEGESD